MKTLDFYVYVHKRKDNGVVFYVGHGRRDRCNHKGAGKTKDWLKIDNEAGGHDVQMLEDNLSKEQAKERELFYIENPKEGWTLVNKRKPTVVHELNYEELSSIFYYDETSPSGLRYKVNRYKNKGAISKKAGEPAGVVKLQGKDKLPRGYIVTTGSKYQNNITAMMAHRIVWLLCKGSLDNSLVIDHVDGNPLNNTISNLREVTYLENSRNKKVSISTAEGKTGFTGITLHREHTNPIYRASWVNTSGKVETKSFSWKKYGRDIALQMAIKARLSATENSGWTDRHIDRDR